jgi:hypothetical protein
MEYFKIELDGNHFVDSYLVYIIEVTNDEYGRFFYVGQTGDRNHFTARPAFRRLSAHLSDQGRSTENQLYRHIATQILKYQLEKNKVFKTETKADVAKFLRKAKICMHVFPIRAFDRALISEHKANREFVELVENEVISQILNRHGSKFVLNKRLPKVKREVSREILRCVEQIILTACP